MSLNYTDTGITGTYLNKEIKPIQIENGNITLTNYRVNNEFSSGGGS